MNCFKLPTSAQFAFRSKKPSTKSVSTAQRSDIQMSPLFRLPPEIRNIIYAHVLRGTEQPFFFIENSEVWRCGPSPAFLRPGPPSLLRVSRLVAEEASQILHEVRELRLMVISQGVPTARFGAYHRFCSLEAFIPVLKRIHTLTLIVNTHPGARVDEPYLQLLDWICTLLEQREVPIRNLGMIMDCCYGDLRRACRVDKFDLARRFQELQPTFVDHKPWNAKCTWAKIKQTEGRYRRAAVMLRAEPMREPGDGVIRRVHAVQDGLAERWNVY